MASFNSPALDHAIADDIPALVELLRHLSAMDYTGSTDIPTGAIRWNKSNRLFENYDGTSWISLGKLGHDVETVDGYSAHGGIIAGTIPVRGADGAIPGGVTGNAATATLAAGLSQILGVDKGGTGASTTAQARVNLGVGYGTAAGSVCQGNDVRLSDARTPLAHMASHKTEGADAITPADIGALATANASSAAKANYVIQRDAAGRAQVAAPSASGDIARKAEVDAAATTAEWVGVTGKPTTYAPATHNHAATEITSGALPIANGGTGATNVSDAQKKLEILTAPRIFGVQNFNAYTTAGRWIFEADYHINGPQVTVTNGTVGGILTVKRDNLPGAPVRLTQTYEAWGPGDVRQAGITFTRGYHADAGIWSKWYNNSWQPDVSTRYSIPSPYTMPYDGFLLVELYATYTTGGQAWGYIDGCPVVGVRWDMGSYTVHARHLIPVRKGSVVSVSGGCSLFMIMASYGWV